MGFKQPRVPEYRENESVGKYLRTLALFLKDFCNEAWTASNSAKKGLEGIRIEYPVTSVNKKTGDVVLGAADVGALGSGETAANAQKLGGKLPEEYLGAGATAANAEKLAGRTWAALMLEIYPVGAIYMSTASASPASLFGGTWEQLKDRFLLAAGSSYAAGSTGGAANVTLTTAQIPNHTHKIARGSTAGGTNEFPANSISILDNACQVITSAQNRYISLTGGTASTGGGAHSNMPPYLCVYIWKRVS